MSPMVLATTPIDKLSGARGSWVMVTDTEEREGSCGNGNIDSDTDTDQDNVRSQCHNQGNLGSVNDRFVIIDYNQNIF